MTEHFWSSFEKAANDARAEAGFVKEAGFSLGGMARGAGEFIGAANGLIKGEAGHTTSALVNKKNALIRGAKGISHEYHMGRQAAEGYDAGKHIQLPKVNLQGKYTRTAPVYGPERAPVRNLDNTARPPMVAKPKPPPPAPGMSNKTKAMIGGGAALAGGAYLLGKHRGKNEQQQQMYGR